jgi:hypothetical protein
MSNVSQSQHCEGRVSDRVPRASGCLGVIHVPKCGGSAVRAVLGQIAGCYTGPLYFDEDFFGRASLAEAVPSPNRESIASLSELTDVVAGHRLVMGHYGASTLVESGCDSLAMEVREPRARLLSLYRFWRAQAESERASWGPWGNELIARADRPLNEFLSCPEVWPAVDNVVVRQTMGFRTRRRVFGRRPSPPAAAYEEFRRRVSIVEWSSRSDEFLERICGQLGESTWPDLGRVNTTEMGSGVQQIDAATMHLLRRLTSVDRSFLDRLSKDGILRRRSAADLDSEFEATAERMDFELR